jgi:hypothetical protein
MCVAKGAPDHPGKQTEQQKGMQDLWDFLYSHNAVFLGDPGLKEDLNQFLKKNKVKRGEPTEKQKEYEGLVDKAVQIMAILREDKGCV